MAHKQLSLIIVLVLCSSLISGCMAGKQWPILADDQKESPARKPETGLPTEPTERLPSDSDQQLKDEELLSKMETDSTYQTDPRAFTPEFRRGAARKKEDLQKQKDLMQDSSSLGESFKVDKKFVEQRLAIYQERKKHWNELAGKVVSLDMGGAWPSGWHGCVQNVEMVSFGYSRLLENEGLEQNGRARVNIWRLLSMDIGYTESGCNKLLAESNSNVTQTLSNYLEMADKRAIDLVRQYYNKGLYPEAAKAFEDLQGGNSYPDELKKMYSLALLRTGRLRDAAEFIGQMVAEHDDHQFRQYVNNKIVEVEYADLLMLLGHTDQARKVYSEVDKEFAVIENRADWIGKQMQIMEDDSSKLPIYQDFLRAYYSYDGRQTPKGLRRGYDKIDHDGDSLMQVAAGLLLQDIENQAEMWLDEQLAVIDELIHDNEYKHALEIVNQLLDNAPESQQYSLLQIKEDIEIEASKEKQARHQLQKQQTAQQWQEAVKLFDLKEYEAAIALFTELLNSDYDAKARRKLSEASNLAASEIRRKAAGLFIRARKAKDLEKKKQILLESQTLLVGLIEKYPTAGIINKANQNLRVIEEQISEIEFRLNNVVPGD